MLGKERFWNVTESDFEQGESRPLLPSLGHVGHGRMNSRRATCAPVLYCSPAQESTDMRA